jgi:hypothetical protein
MTNLHFLRLNDNQLTNLTLPPGLNQATLMEMSGNKLASLVFPAGLTSLMFLNLNGNQLTNITLPPDMLQLIALFIAGNPLASFVVSEPLAATGLASVVDSLQTQGARFHLPVGPPDGPATSYGWRVQIRNHRAAWGVHGLWLHEPCGLEHGGGCDQSVWQRQLH